MRKDQRERLAEASERLAEVVLRDIDPDNWTASGKTLLDMSKAERGDANWCRKTAAQSVALLVRVEQLLADPNGAPPPPPDGEEESEEEKVRRAEAKASELLERVQRATAAR